MITKISTRNFKRFSQQDFPLEAISVLAGPNNSGKSTLLQAAMVWNLVCYWVLGFPLGLWLCFGWGWGAAGMWVGLCLALVLIGIGLTVRWHNLTRLNE